MFVTCFISIVRYFASSHMFVTCVSLICSLLCVLLYVRCHASSHMFVLLHPLVYTLPCVLLYVRYLASSCMFVPLHPLICWLPCIISYARYHASTHISVPLRPHFYPTHRCQSVKETDKNPVLTKKRRSLLLHLSHQYKASTIQRLS